MSTLHVDLHKIARVTNWTILGLAAGFLAAGVFVSFWFHFLSVPFLLLAVMNVFYRHVQTRHTILRNFGVLGQMRYVLESLGPELRQYLFANDREERPFNREERSEVYRKAKGVDSALAFGSQTNYDDTEIKVRHSMYPTDKRLLVPYRLVLGEERGLDSALVLNRHILISAMSFGALGEHAVRSLARGAREAGIAMNTGEGGWPKHHLEEGGDLIFQMGTAKFGVRTDDGLLDDAKLAHLASQDGIRAIEIKFSQGAKPGKGGLLPAEKISAEIAELRGVPQGKDVVSPPAHPECRTPAASVDFIRRVQEVSGLPVGIKFCVGRREEVVALFEAMRRKDIFPDYIAVDGGQGGTGAAPKAFMDGYGLPLFPALEFVHSTLVDLGVRHRTKILAAGKLISPARQVIALCIGADAIYSARGFMLALGCIQALLCSNNTCPVGITTHDPSLQRGLVIEDKARRVVNYVEGLAHDLEELVAAAGVRSVHELGREHLYIPSRSILAGQGIR